MSEPELHTKKCSSRCFPESPLIENLLKEMSLKTRLKVPLEMEYLNITLEPDTCCTEEEFQKAHEWAERMANWMLKEVNEWEADGRPTRET
jgi:hypothetical protein